MHIPKCKESLEIDYVILRLGRDALCQVLHRIIQKRLIFANAMLSQVREVIYLANQFPGEYIKVGLISWKLQVTVGIPSSLLLGVLQQCIPVRPRTRGLVGLWSLNGLP